MFDTKSFTEDLAQIPQFQRGKVWCTVCGNEQSVDATSAALGGGWPTCCGYTMTIDSPDERARREGAQDVTDDTEDSQN